MISSWLLHFYAQQLLQGGVIAYPTEAVWGLGCDPWNEQAVHNLLKLKKRSIRKGLILIASSIEQFNFLLKDLPEEKLHKLQQSWPGPYTWLVPHNDLIPYWITGDHTTVALRVSSHPLVKKLCELTGPIISTSANLAGQPAAKTRLMIEYYFHQQLAGVLNGELGEEKKPSQIHDLMKNTIIRAS